MSLLKRNQIKGDEHVVITHPENSRIVVTYEQITPEVAQEYLTKNISNRALNKKNVTRMAGDQSAARWNNQNPAPIIFDRSGTLIDGQHRLSSVVMSGKPIVSLVVRGVDVKVMPTVDLGKSRSLTDILQIENKSGKAQWRNCKNLAAVAGGCLLFSKRGDLRRGDGGQFSPLETKQFLDSNADYLQELTSWAVSCNKHCAAFSKFATTKGLATFRYALLQRGADYEDVDEFFAQLTMQSAPCQPILKLRAHLEKIASQNSGDTQGNQDYSMAVMTKAWNAFITGNTVERIYWSPGGKRPEKFPELVIPEIA